MSLKEEIARLIPDSGNLNACYTCGVCASGCPASALSDMDPRKFIRLLSMEKDEAIFESDWVWVCTTCNRCLTVCPMKIDIPRLVYHVRSRWPRDKRPAGIADYCSLALNQQSLSARLIDDQDFKVITQTVAQHIKKKDPAFKKMKVPIDKKEAQIFLNQSCEMVLDEPAQMGILWKILHMAGADWTYGTTGWAAENYCMFLADDKAWKALIKKKVKAVERLKCRVLLNTECGHDFFAVKSGLEKFDVPHRFQVKNIIEYYAQWIREKKLKVDPNWNIDLKITFTVQDPCQLVRKSYGDLIAEELRFIIKECVGEGNFIDMSPNRSNNYCCGGGGGAIRTDFYEQRMTYGKIKLDQIVETGAAFCITPCNNCYSQINDLSSHFQAGFKTIHLWTVIAMGLGILDPVTEFDIERFPKR